MTPEKERLAALTNGYSSWRQLIALSAPKASALIDEYGLSRRPPRPAKDDA
jgi:hypothetical protein